MVDLDAIERLAKAATPGPYELGQGERECGSWYEQFPTAGRADFRHENGEADAAYLAALDPATVLELVRLARLGARVSRETHFPPGTPAIIRGGEQMHVALEQRYLTLAPDQDIEFLFTAGRGADERVLHLRFPADPGREEAG